MNLERDINMELSRSACRFSQHFEHMEELLLSAV